MKRTLIICIFILSCLSKPCFAQAEAEQSKIDKYLSYIKMHSPNKDYVGDHTKGEIEIILDPSTIEQVQEKHKNYLLKKGLDNQQATYWSEIGVVEGDADWVWIRDPVILPSGRKTIKGRLNWKKSNDGTSSVATLPVLEDKRIVVCLKYCHAARSWQIELPRGQRHVGEAAGIAAKRELQSETGFITTKQLFLGSASASSANFNVSTPIFLCHVSKKVDPTKMDEKAVLGHLILTKDELKEAYLKGYIPLKINKEILNVTVTDANLSFALFQAEIRDLI